MRHPDATISGIPCVRPVEGSRANSGSSLHGINAIDKITTSPLFLVNVYGGEECPADEEDEMTNQSFFGTIGRRAFMKGAAAAATLPITASIAGRAFAAQEPVTLTVWSWINGLEQEVALFEAANPNIKINIVNLGSAAEHYQKFRNAIKAGTGGPDVMHLELHMIPTFDIVKGLADIAPYGAKEMAPEFEEWVWNIVASGERVVAMPLDSGPIGMIHRSDVFKQFKITPPTTWAEFAEAAVKLREQTKEHYLTNTTFNDQTWTTGLLWQAGSRPFKVNGTELEIAVNDPAAKAVAKYWQELIAKDAVSTAPGFNTEWYTALDQGKYATWLTAAWAPLFLSQFAKSSSGKWAVAPIPQWDAAKPVSGNSGGSSFSVTTQSAHPKEAAEFVKFLTGNTESASMFTSKQFFFPTKTEVLKSPEFASRKFDFYNGQAVNAVFIASSNTIAKDFQFSPFQDYVGSQFESELGVAAANKTSLEEALDRMQTNIVDYAKSQGFTVKS